MRSEEETLFTSFLHMISHILNAYLTAFVVFTGISLNLFSIYVFLRCERSSAPAIQYYLVTLTIWQTALLANAFLLYSFPHILFGHLVSQVWIVLTLTIDRYLALCQPLKHRAIGKKSRVKRLMVIVSLLAVLFSSPRFFEVHVVQFCNEYNECVAVIDRTALFENGVYWTVYHVLLAMLFVTLCPCLLLSAFTLRISLALRAAVTKRHSMCAPSADVDSRNRKGLATKKEHKSNIMLVLVIAKFLVSDILPTVIDVLEHIVGQSAFMQSPLASLFVDLSNFLIVLNCSSNFWVFVIWGKRFRRSCRHVLLSCEIGESIYRLGKVTSDPDIVTCCGQSSLTTMQNTKIYGSDGKSRKLFRDSEADRDRQVRVSNYSVQGGSAISEKSAYKSISEDCRATWEYENLSQLEEVDEQKLIR
ncbi:hypothetical protein V3C99_019202 [Haemonchus contortus]|uniref:G_PROTEIN_RECEP_F1_2 domain-containing protein n=1 Tax=Haemonchus contortus TaxID=6289 RepID=A0A7I4YYI8_HAECO